MIGVKRSNWMSTTALWSAGAAAFVPLAIGTAKADSLFIQDRNISVLERERPEFAAEGIKAGQFIVKPRLEIGAGYTSNAFLLSDIPKARGLEAYEEESDLFFIARPAVRADSLWSRHSLSVGAYADTFTNRRFDTESFTNYGFFSRGQIDLTRDAALTGKISFDHLTETRRANTSSVLTTDPVEFDLSQIILSGFNQIGRIRYKLEAAYKEFNFYDVTIVPIPGIAETQVADQDFRDRRSYSLLGKIALAINPDISLFFSPSYNSQVYDQEPLPGQDGTGDIFDRDSEGWNLQLGADFDITKLLRGSFAIGKFEQRYDDDRFSKADGTSINVALEWFPREATTISLRSRRGADESALRSLGGSVVTETVLRLDQEIRHNVIGYALTGYGTLDYPDLITVTQGTPSPEDDTLDRQKIERFRVGLGATWYHSRNLSTSLDYLYETQNVQVNLLEGGFDSDYGVHQLMVTARLQR